MFNRMFGGYQIPEHGYTVGDSSPAGRAEAQMAMLNDEAAGWQAVQDNLGDYMAKNPEVATGWKLNWAGPWQNARMVAAASQWFNGYFRPGQDTVAKPFILQGGVMPGGQEEDAPDFRPGLTGGVTGKPMYRPYNNGDFSTQQSGPVGPYHANPVNQGSVSTFNYNAPQRSEFDHMNDIYRNLPNHGWSDGPQEPVSRVAYNPNWLGGDVYSTPGNTVNHPGIGTPGGMIGREDGTFDPRTGMQVGPGYAPYGRRHDMFRGSFGRNR